MHRYVRKDVKALALFTTVIALLAVASAAGVAIEAASAATNTPTHTPTNTPIPTATLHRVEPIPTEAITEASISPKSDINVYEGPSSSSPVIGSLKMGEASKIHGKNADVTWLQVEYPPNSDGRGWVEGARVLVSGDLSTVSVVDVTEPTATPTGEPAADATATATSVVVPTDTPQPTAEATPTPTSDQVPEAGGEWGFWATMAAALGMAVVLGHVARQIAATRA